MIPYFQFETINLGFFSFQIWGVMVVFGIAAGMLVSYCRAKRQGLEAGRIADLTLYILISVFVFARLFHVFFYDWPYYSRNFLDILKIWRGGLSISGGFFGAVLAGLIYFKINKLNFWQWADICIFGLPLGLFIGRIGCFLIHGHPGIMSDSLLAAQFSDASRYDLGLLLSLNGLVLFLLFLFLDRRQRFTGFYAVLFSAWYGVIRFLLDFLRAYDLPQSDVRYFDLTPAQYFSIVLVITAVWFWLKLRKKTRSF